MTSPDPRQLAERMLQQSWNPGSRIPELARALLSALDALEQAGGGQAGKAESGSTAEPCSVVEPWPYVPEPHSGEHCQECGRGYARMVYRVPDDLWEVLSAGDNLLCPPCFDARCRSVQVALYWEATQGDFPAVPLGRTSHAFSTGDCRQAVAPTSAVSASPPSVEALEAELERTREQRDEAEGLLVIERLTSVKAEVGRDQANKERDEAWQAILRIYRTPVYEESGKPASGISVALIRAINDAAALALAGVPGGGRQEGQEEQEDLGEQSMGLSVTEAIDIRPPKSLGGTAGAVPGGSDPKGDT